jgi:hypothetical protein
MHESTVTVLACLSDASKHQAAQGCDQKTVDEVVVLDVSPGLAYGKLA